MITEHALLPVRPSGYLLLHHCYDPPVVEHYELVQSGGQDPG